MILFQVALRCSTACHLLRPAVLQAQVANERIAALLEDRKVREQEWARHRANYELQVRQLADKLRKCEEVLRSTTKDCILGG
jgi:coiled-coil domain-containing protein 77